MEQLDQLSIQLGKDDAQWFIGSEQIDYDPFIAISDLHLVRKTVPISFDSFKTTISDLDPALWAAIDKSVDRLAAEHGESFSTDDYAIGFSEGVAAVWEKIRDSVL